MRASSRIPPVALAHVSQRARNVLDTVENFVEQQCIPAELTFQEQLGIGDERWKTKPQVMRDLVTRARSLGLWNLFLAGSPNGPGFSNLEYALMAEYLGKSFLAPEATNTNAPDSGNIELLEKYASDAQKQLWLAPLLDGKIRSAFLMTEPDIASSDARNIRFRIRREGSHYTLHGTKWWSSGAGDPHCKLFIVMGQSTSHSSDPYRQQTVVLVPVNTPGIQIKRMLNLYGYDDAPHGHAEVTFENVRIPLSNVVLGQGRGFEIIQGRLGPGRLHHTMRIIGAAERALEWMIMRPNDTKKVVRGGTLSQNGVILDWIGRSRIEIDSARLRVLDAAIKMDTHGAKTALGQIGQAKVLVPQMALTVVDRAIQLFGAAGVSQDTPLAYLWATVRGLRIADGPDEVHLNQLGRRENKERREQVAAKLESQKSEAECLAKGGFEVKSRI